MSWLQRSAIKSLHRSLGHSQGLREVAGLSLTPAGRYAQLFLEGVDIVDGKTDRSDVAGEEDGGGEFEESDVPVITRLVVQRIVDDLGHSEENIVRLGAGVEVVVPQADLQLGDEVGHVGKVWAVSHSEDPLLVDESSATEMFVFVLQGHHPGEGT